MAADFTVIDPTKIFWANGEVNLLVGTPISLTVANNQQVIAASTGKKLRIMGLMAQSNGAAAGSLTLRSNSGGTMLLATFAPPPNTLAPYLMPITNSGYFETATGHGLFADCATTAIGLTVFTVLYTPF